MRRLLAAVFLVSVPLSYVPTASAGCIGPEIRLDSSRAKVGENVQLRGQFFFERCDDTGGSGESGGCFGGDDEIRGGYGPTRDIEIQIRPRGGSGRSATLGSIDADEQGEVSFAFAVPDLKPGEYVVTANEISRASLVIAPPGSGGSG